MSSSGNSGKLPNEIMVELHRRFSDPNALGSGGLPSQIGLQSMLAAAAEANEDGDVDGDGDGDGDRDGDGGRDSQTPSESGGSGGLGGIKVEEEPIDDDQNSMDVDNSSQIIIAPNSSTGENGEEETEIG